MEEKHKEILENIEDVVLLIKEEKINYINSYGAYIFGYSKEELKGKNFLKFVGESSQETVKENYKKNNEGKKVFPYEASFKRKNGDLICGEVKSKKTSFNGDFFNLVVIRDVSKKKKLEEVFRRQEEKFHAVAENIPDVIACFDEEARYTYVNKAAEKLYGIPKKSFFWKKEEDIKELGEDKESFKEAIKLVFKHKKKKEFYTERKFHGEKRYYYVILVPEFNEKKEVVLVHGIMRDITEIKMIDEAKSEFIAMTTHQLRTPLSRINWCSLLLLQGEGGELSKDQEEYLKKIREETGGLIRTTDALLNTKVLDLNAFVFNLEKTDVVALAKEASEKFKENALQKEISFSEEYDENLREVKTDTYALKIILKALLSNAVNYTNKGGEITFSVKKKESKIVVDIGDSGIGIKKEERKKIFEKFYRSQRAKNKKVHGLGLGLYLVNSILEKIEGEITFFSPHPKFKKGSLFRIEFPLFEDSLDE